MECLFGTILEVGLIRSGEDNMTSIHSGLAIGAARCQQFSKIIQSAGRIKRGLVVQQMHITEQTLAREYTTYLEQLTNITYDSKTREFIWSNQ